MQHVHRTGTQLHVWVGGTRPRGQGVRITGWKLGRAGIPHSIILDGGGPLLLARGEVDAVPVEADRIAANGEVANKARHVATRPRRASGPHPVRGLRAVVAA